MPRIESRMLQPDTLSFLQQAISEGAFDQKPPHISPDRWATIRNTSGTYLVSSAATLEKVGAVFGVSLERVRQIKEDCIKIVWGNCSEQTRLKFPWGSFSLTKTFPEAVRVKSFRQQSESYLDLDSRLRTVDSFAWAYEILAQVTAQKYERIARLPNPSLASLSSGIARIGFHIRPQELGVFIGTLSLSQFPIGSHTKGVGTYHYYPTVFHNQMSEILSADETLQPFLLPRVRQICGPKVEIPTTTSLLGNTGYKRVAPILRKNEIDPNNYLRPKSLLRDFFDDGCDIPIFQIGKHSGKFYPVEYRELLEAFVRNRSRQLLDSGTPNSIAS